MSRNIAITLAYDGTNFVGWQIQPNGVSVQSVVEAAIEQLTQVKTSVLSAGRTDSGVHAIGQVANFRTESTIPLDRLPRALQNFLPDDIVVRNAFEVPFEFHATHSAKKKRYRYVIFNQSTSTPFLRDYAYRHKSPLDVDAMHDAAQALIGMHDFRCFESHYPNTATSIRTISEISVSRHSTWPFATGLENTPISPTSTLADGEFVWFDVVADGFLYNMVRAIVGTLIHVGRGRWTRDDIARIVQQQDRAHAGETAPAHGLYLVKVDYGDEI
ncbi:MAG: tRNA pseudouridine(38-40) synthase TruA [Planctomycetaceae bacterium]|nr:tRNA pseudouridine(38-40) synthase TruA [Planctomycetaceae bacterium]